MVKKVHNDCEIMKKRRGESIVNDEMMNKMEVNDCERVY